MKFTVKLHSCLLSKPLQQTHDDISQDIAVLVEIYKKIFLLNTNNSFEPRLILFVMNFLTSDIFVRLTNFI